MKYSKTAVIIEDSKPISQIWQDILEKNSIQTLKVFENADAIENEIVTIAPDIVLMDINLSGKIDGVQLTSTLTHLNPSIRILILSMHNDMNYMQKAKDAGARGYLQKNSSINEISFAIEEVLANNLYFNNLTH